MSGFGLPTSSARVPETRKMERIIASEHLRHGARVVVDREPTDLFILHADPQVAGRRSAKHFRSHSNCLYHHPIQTKSKSGFSHHSSLSLEIVPLHLLLKLRVEKLDRLVCAQVVESQRRERARDVSQEVGAGSQSCFCRHSEFKRDVSSVSAHSDEPTPSIHHEPKNFLPARTAIVVGDFTDRPQSVFWQADLGCVLGNFDPVRMLR
jgi:hypothetical protein